MLEDLGKKDITPQEVQLCWQSRRERMAMRRQYFEPLWRNGLNQFFEGIIPMESGTKALYNTLYEQYDFSLFSRDGLRFNKLRYPLIQAVTMRALSNELPNKPKPNFVAIGSNDPTRATAFRHLFDQVLYEMDAAEEDFEIFLDKRIFGSAVVMTITESYEVTVEDPDYNAETEKYTYKKKTKKIQQCMYKKLDLRHVFLDEHCVKTNLKDCNYAQVDEYFSKEDALRRFAEYPKIKDAIATAINDTVYFSGYDPQGVEYVKITHSFDRIHDRYHILGNGILLNDKDNPIPRRAGRRGKEIPISLAVQYKIPGAPYGYGDSHLTTTFNHIKNLVRVMILEITQKMAKPLMAIDPMSNFDEQEFEWGTDFIRVAPDDLKQLQINPDLKSLYDLDELTDNDVIRTTGININDTANIDAGETARKTIIRRESQNALVELTLSYMSSSFFKRLYTLLKDDIQLHYGARIKAGEKIKVQTKGVLLKRNQKGFDEEQVKGFRYFDMKAGDMDFDMDLDLELGNIASSRELDRALAVEGIEQAAKMPDGFDPAGLAKWLASEFRMPDYVRADKGTGVQDKDPEELANEGLSPDELPDHKRAEMEQPMEGDQSDPTMPPEQLPAQPPQPIPNEL